MTKKDDLVALYDNCEKHFDDKVIFSKNPLVNRHKNYDYQDDDRAQRVPDTRPLPKIFSIPEPARFSFKNHRVYLDMTNRENTQKYSEIPENIQKYPEIPNNK